MTTKTRYFLAGSTAILVGGIGTAMIAYYAGGFQPVAASAVASELRYVPAHASVVAYADVRSIMDSELRIRLKQAMPDQQQHGQKEFQEHTGIDIERDIDYIVAAAMPGVTKGGLVVARGRFNTSLLESLIRERGGLVEEYKGKRLVTGPKPAEGVDARPGHPSNFALAFLEPDLIAIGETASVRSAIDAQMSAQSITGNAEMMDLVNDIGRGNNAWAVGRFDLMAQQAQLHEKLPSQAIAQLNLVKWFAAAGHINGGVEGSLRAEARDDQAGEELRKGVDGLMAFARLAAQADPKAQALVQSLQVGGRGKSVTLTFTVPAELLDLAIPKPPAPPAQ